MHFFSWGKSNPQQDKVAVSKFQITLEWSERPFILGIAWCSKRKLDNWYLHYIPGSFMERKVPFFVVMSGPNSLNTKQTNKFCLKNLHLRAWCLNSISWNLWPRFVNKCKSEKMTKERNKKCPKNRSNDVQELPKTFKSLLKSLENSWNEVQKSKQRNKFCQQKLHLRLEMC